MTTTTPPVAQPSPSGLTDPTVRLDWKTVAPSFLLIAIYAMLSFIAFGNQDSFYESMEIPVPENEFLIWSWAGKNTAVLVGLVIATVTRLRVLMLTAIAMLFTMQMGDVNAGAQSDTNVFITWIAFGVTLVQVGLIALHARRTA